MTQPQHLRLRCSALSLIIFALFGLSGCTDQPAVKIGYVGGLSGRVADLGLAGRNGAILAVENQNQIGGINGKDIELVVMDDKQNEEAARESVSALLEQKVDAIIGPLTSSMSQVTVPLVNKQQVVMISPTSTTEELTGIDDYFFRVIASTSHYAAHHAFHLYEELGLKNISAIYDLSNSSFSESYFREFRETYESLGGRVDKTATYSSGPGIRFYDLASKAIGPDTEGLLIIASAVDTAVLCQQIRKIHPEIRIATSEWSATEKLIELGGEAVEGILFHQFFNRDSVDPDYLKFRKNYVKRFSSEPGFASVVSYDATKIALEGIKNRHGRTLKETLIATSTFPGAQGPIMIDRFGDTNRPSYLSTIKNGRFVILEIAHKHK